MFGNQDGMFFRRHADIFSWKYAGPLIKNGPYVHSQMNIKKSRFLIEQADGIPYTNPTIDHDPCFIILKSNTENWPIRPCSILGFDIDANCYGALGILINDGNPTNAVQAKELLTTYSFLEFSKLLKNRMCASAIICHY